MAATKTKTPPKYIVRLDSTGYYSHDVHWQSVPRNKATRMTHKEARAVMGHLRGRGLRYPSSVEKA